MSRRECRGIAWGALGLVAGLSACGGSAKQDPEAELAALDDGATLVATATVSPAPECGSFAPCGGLLAGTWEVIATCGSDPAGRRALEPWGKPFVTLDSSACAGTVQLSSEWSGGFEFAQGLFSDHRTRTDHVQMTLDPACLSATLRQNVDTHNLASVCSSLSKTAECALLNGSCQCSGSNQQTLTESDVYGILQTSAVLGSDRPSESAVFDYCATSNQLRWREQSGGLDLALRRTGAATDPSDSIRSPR